MGLEKRGETDALGVKATAAYGENLYFTLMLKKNNWEKRFQRLGSRGRNCRLERKRMYEGRRTSKKRKRTRLIH